MKLKRPGFYLALILVFIAGLIGLDQWVKALVQAQVPTGVVTPFIPGVIDIVYVQNTGAAFSLFSGSSTFLMVLRILVCGVMIFLFVRYRKRLHALLCVSMSLIIAGALGNLIDQIFLGYVRDMFSFAFVNFAIFNVADCCITVGAVLLFIDLLFLKKGKALLEKPEKEPEAAD